MHEKRKALLWRRLPVTTSAAGPLLAIALCAALSFRSGTAGAQAAPEEPASTLGAPAPYSLPFQLRPVAAPTLIRSDTSFGAYQNPAGQGGFAVVSELTGLWHIPGIGSGPRNGLAPVVKLTVVNDSPPGTATGGFAFVNPLLGALYATDLGSDLRASAFLGVTLPIGMGGGDTPDKGALDARTVGPVIRSGLDNPLFAVNDLALIPGVDIAYVAHGLTLQAEATFCQLERVRGAQAQLEASKTALTAGAHAAYFVTDFLSLGAEYRFQWWIDPPFVVEDHKPNTSYTLSSIAVGARFHFKVASDVWIRPAVSYTRGFNPPMTPQAANDNIVQLDIPVVF